MKTTFGGLLTAFQKEKKLAIELAHRALKKRNPEALGYEYRDSHIVTHLGDTILTTELWVKIDEEHTKLSTGITTETLKKMEVKKLTTEPAPPPLPVVPKAEESLEDLMS